MDFALTMALANVAGSLLGTRLALKHGAGFVRVIFIGVVSALILKTGIDALSNNQSSTTQAGLDRHQSG